MPPTALFEMQHELDRLDQRWASRSRPRCRGGAHAARRLGRAGRRLDDHARQRDRRDHASTRRRRSSSRSTASASSRTRSSTSSPATHAIHVEAQGYSRSTSEQKAVAGHHGTLIRRRARSEAGEGQLRRPSRTPRIIDRRPADRHDAADPIEVPAGPARRHDPASRPRAGRARADVRRAGSSRVLPQPLAMTARRAVRCHTSRTPRVASPSWRRATAIAGAVEDSRRFDR